MRHLTQGQRYTISFLLQTGFFPNVHRASSVGKDKPAVIELLSEWKPYLQTATSEHGKNGRA
ncbi:MAG: hypothetical protein CRN43_13980 [Candidatus Nephrothrix sp. EaCA]|nr:MAG: hypothetical protein CRN43_13980 [Candidatus Nephrothrix sp. EaCA]